MIPRSEDWQTVGESSKWSNGRLFRTSEDSDSKQIEIPTRKALKETVELEVVNIEHNRQ